MRTRDQALDGTAPILLIHRPHANRSRVPRLLAGILAATGGSVSLGAVTALPSVTEQVHREWLESCPSAALLIADPQGYRMVDGGGMSGSDFGESTLRRWPYLKQEPALTASIVDAQRQVGANLLLSPGRALDSVMPAESLAALTAEGDETASVLLPGERMALNVTIDGAWLQRQVLRDQLLIELLEQEHFDTWYVRVRLPRSVRPPEQAADVELLSGLKELASLAAEQERNLLLPQSGVTGWLQLAFGAAGFGSGLSLADQAFKAPLQGLKRDGEPPPRKELYFEPALLHTVNRATHDVLLAQPDYLLCDCPYCPSLHANPWNHTTAALHGLHRLGRLTNLATTGGRGGPAVAVRRAVREARETARRWPLADVNLPRHLSIWDPLL